MKIKQAGMTGKTHIDIDHLEKYVAGDEALRDEILSIFVDQAQKLAEEFSITLADQEWKDTAHALKGASRGVGAWALGDLCEQAEVLVGTVSAKMENRASLLVSIREKLCLSLQDARAVCDARAEAISV